MNVFIGGSRAVSKLNKVIRTRLDDLMKRGCTIFVGDANGADKAVQTYFANRRYSSVVVFWDAKSKGTLQNMLNLIAAGKRTLVYFAPTKDFHVLANDQDLQTLLARCEKRDLDAASRGLGLKTPITQMPLSLRRL